MGRAGFAMSAHLMIILRTMARFSGDWKLVKAEETDSGVPRPFCEKNMNYKILFIISWFKIGKKKFYFTVLRIKNKNQKEKKRNFQLKLVLHGDYLFLHYNFPNEAPLFHTENMKQISQKKLKFFTWARKGMRVLLIQTLHIWKFKRTPA